MSARGMTGYNWSGRETNFRSASHEYGAIHFHDDDLDDAGWGVDFSLTIPTHPGAVSMPHVFVQKA